MHWCGSPVYCVDHVQIGWINTIAWKLLLLATAKAWMCRSVGFFTATWLLYLIIGVSFVNWWLIMEKDISKIVCEARPYRFRIRLDITYFYWNWKHYSKIIFKCVNSTVGPVNSALVSCTVNPCDVTVHALKKTKNKKRKRVWKNMNPNTHLEAMLKKFSLKDSHYTLIPCLRTRKNEMYNILLHCYLH